MSDTYYVLSNDGSEQPPSMSKHANLADAVREFDDWINNFETPVLLRLIDPNREQNRLDLVAENDDLRARNHGFEDANELLRADNTSARMQATMSDASNQVLRLENDKLIEKVETQRQVIAAFRRKSTKDTITMEQLEEAMQGASVARLEVMIETNQKLIDLLTNKFICPGILAIIRRWRDNFENRGTDKLGTPSEVIGNLLLAEVAQIDGWLAEIEGANASSKPNQTAP